VTTTKTKRIKLMSFFERYSSKQENRKNAVIVIGRKNRKKIFKNMATDKITLYLTNVNITCEYILGLTSRG
jgi:hypothetical protein